MICNSDGSGRQFDLFDVTELLCILVLKKCSLFVKSTADILTSFSCNHAIFCSVGVFDITECIYRATSCLENLEMLGKLTAVRDICVTSPNVR